MGYSVPELEAMLDEVETRLAPSAPPPLGIAPDYFMPSTSGGASVVTTPQEPALSSEVPSQPSSVESVPQPTPASFPPSAAAPPRAESKDEFAEFAPLRRPRGLPPEARDITCNKVVRDPDSGRITEILTYKLPEGSA